jgi:hypothetical protein
VISFDSNVQLQLERISSMLLNLDVGKITKEMATTTLGMMRDRIHEKGRASDGSGIGTYSPAYMKVRTGMYGNAKVAKRGKSKGKNTNSGSFTKGANRGKPRPNYNRSTSTEVILSLTREMENDLGAFIAENGLWSIGFIRNPSRKSGKKHSDIARIMERKYGKLIYSLDKDEEAKVESILQDYVNDWLKV